MMRLRDLTIRTKLYGMSIFSTLTLMAVLGMWLWCMGTFRVNGPVYREIARNKDMVADILPPPLYIIESDLAMQQAEDTDDGDELALLQERVQKLEAEYHQRLDEWRVALPDGELKATLEDSSRPALEFYRLARTSYFPARIRGDRAAARAVIRGPLQSAYIAHRAQIDKTVALAVQGAAHTERVTADRTTFWVRLMIALSILAVAWRIFSSLSVSRSVVSSTNLLLRRVEEMAAGAGDLSVRVPIESKDEMGRLASGINTTLEKMEAILQRMKAAEGEAAHLRNLLRNIIDSMPSILIGVDAQGAVTHWNREAERVTGVSGGAAVGRALTNVMPQWSHQAEMVHQAVKDSTVQSGERMEWETAAGPMVSDLTVYPLVADGVNGAVVRIDDVTTRVRLQEMMVQSEKMHSIGGLAAGMAHEINNPLAGMLQSAQVVLNRFSPDLPANQRAATELGVSLSGIESYIARREIRPLLEGIRESGQRAAGIVRNMLSFSRRSTGNLQPHALPDLLDRTLVLAQNDFDLKRKMDLRHIEIVRQYAADLPAVECQETEFQQVILNLLKNAVQAMADAPTPVAQPRITIRTWREGNTARVEVADNGPGMTEAVRRRVFEPFYTTKKAGEGTGLGLAVSYFIVTENHSGTMSVESSPGKGAKFSIGLPLKQKGSG